MPSFINELAVAQLNDLVGSAPGFMLVDASKLKAAEALDIRVKLEGIGAKMKVAKKRLIKVVVPKGCHPHMEGPGGLALIVGEDLAATAKLVNELVKDEKVALMGGGMGTEGFGPEQAKALESMPTKDEARILVAKALRQPLVKLAKSLRVPYTKLARAIKAPHTRLGRAINTHKTKLEGDAA